MKTKSTSDTICVERCCKSTFPFVLDDPKSLDAVSELLIDLCNGRLMGNMKVGLRKPRSIPLICCNFSDTKHQRYIYIYICIYMCTTFAIYSLASATKGELYMGVN